MKALRPDPERGFTQVIGIGGIGTGIAFALEGAHTLGREESRLGTLLSARDYCKLHIVAHYIATLMGAWAPASEFSAAAVGVVGDDASGHELIREMQAAGIDTDWVRIDAARPTLFSTCFVYPDRSGGNITSNNSAAASLSERDIQQSTAAMHAAAGKGIALCLPEVPLEVRRRFLDLAREAGNFRVASFTMAEIEPACAMGLFDRIDLLALNQEEASALVGYACNEENAQTFLTHCAAVLADMQPSMRIVVSFGSRGAYGFADGTWRFCAAPHITAVATGGAGDALLGGVVAGLAAGLPLHSSSEETASALQIGVMLASLSVTSPDAIHFGANLEELERFAAAHGRGLGQDIRQRMGELERR